VLHFVKVLVTFVSWMRKPTVGAGTSNPSAVPVVKALKNFISPFVTTSPPPGNVCRVSPLVSEEPPMDAGISTQVTAKVPQGP